MRITLVHPEQKIPYAASHISDLIAEVSHEPHHRVLASNPIGVELMDTTPVYHNIHVARVRKSKIDGLTPGDVIELADLRL